jgi:hypothetical protein
LGELTFGVEQFLPLSVRRGQSACPLRTVCERCVHRVFVVFVVVFVFDPVFLGFRCSWFADGPSFSSGRSGARADGPPGLRRLSVSLGSFLVVLLALTDCSRLLAGLSVAPLRTVRGSWPDCPRLLAGLSAWPVRTVRPSWPDSPPAPGSFVPWFGSSLLSFVLPRVLQGIVPKT